MCIRDREKTSSAYEIVKKRVDQEVADEVRKFINGEIDDEGNQLTTVNDDGETVLISDPDKSPVRVHGVYMEPDSKRYYPNGTLAANVLGFVNNDNVGGVGLEAKYDSVLQGTAGLTITARENNGNDMLYQYEQYYDAEKMCIRDRCSTICLNSAPVICSFIRFAPPLTGSWNRRTRPPL